MGDTCNLTFAMQRLGIKQENSVFEWHFSKDFNDIIKLIDNKFNNIISENGKIKGTNIYSGHYPDKEIYDLLLKKRSDRFLNDINGDKEILFIRRGYITLLQFENFKKVIYNINPNCNFKFLLVSISTPETFVPIISDKLYHAFLEEKDLPQHEMWMEGGGNIDSWINMLKIFDNIKINNKIITDLDE